jgi:hypothetical protein
MDRGRAAPWRCQPVTLPNNNRQPGILQVRIPQLPDATTFTGTELLWVTQLGRSKKSMLSTVASYIASLVSANPWLYYSGGPQTALTGQRIAASTFGGTWTLTLPVGGAAGDSTEVADVLGTWGTNPLSLDTQSGQTIEGVAAPMSLDVPRARPLFVWDGSTWRIST